MGEVLAVSLRRSARAATLLALLAVAGCGSDTSKTEGSQIALGVAKSLKSKMFSRKAAAPATPDPEKLAQAALKSFEGPIILAQLESSGLLTVLGEYGRNGAVRTYSTPNEQTLVLRDGLLIATRGLGKDLMSSETGEVAGLILARQAGNGRHVYRYLDGEDIERPLPMECSVTSGAAKSYSFAGTSHATVEMAETCRSADGRTVTNSYWVTGSGLVALSRQWIGPGLGYVTIQTVRP